MNSNYWTRISRQNISRRRALLASGGFALGAGFLAACGSGDGNGSGGTGTGSGTGSASPTQPPDTAGLLTQAEDTTSGATVGGTWQHFIETEVLTMDPLNNGGDGSAINNQAYAYSRFFQWRPGLLPENPVGGDFVLDAASGWEQSPDGLRLTFTLRPDVLFDPRPPTNGRAMTTEDVKFSWDNFSTGSLTRFDYNHDLNPHAPITSIEVSDEQTVSFNLAFPIANMASRFAFHRCLSILPSEAYEGFDPKVETRGSGPWTLREWRPSVGYTYDRNPTWHMRENQPYFDTLNLALMPEYSARYAQLVAGEFLHIRVNSDDVLPTKRQTPALNLYDEGYFQGGPSHLAFGFLPDSPFHDERVRRAVSMLINRDLWIDTFYNVSRYESEGLPMTPRWNSHYCADDPRYWLDPQGTGLGEGAAFFQYNPEEATKLIEASGLSTPISVPGLISGAGTEQVTALHGMLEADGLFNIPIRSLTVSEHGQMVWNGEGRFEGIAFQQNMGVRGDIDQYLSTRWSPGGASASQSMFPEVFPWYQRAQDLIDAQRRELDEDRRLGIIEDLQKELALQMPTVAYPGAANTFVLAWPQLANFGVFKGPAAIDDPSIVWTHFWLDESKRPS